MSSIKKKLRSFGMHAYIRLKEKSTVCGTVRLRYLFQKAKRPSDRLIVVFSGFPRDDKPAYNYIRTLKDVDANKLFLLDNEGFESLGTYYLGNGCKWLAEDAVARLTEQFRRKTGSTRLICVGSSKGGTCALLYGLRMNADAVIAGSPQYHIWWYLTHSGQRHLETARLLPEGGTYTPEQIDALLPDAIRLPDRRTKIHLLYSVNELFYKNELVGLLGDIREAGLELEPEAREYEDHGEVSVQFPPYLKKTLKSDTLFAEQKER